MSTLVERLEAFAQAWRSLRMPPGATMVEAFGIEGVGLTLADIEEAAAALRATGQYSVAADSVIGPFPADKANVGIKVARATGEGEWVMVPRKLTDAMFVAHLAHMSVGKKPPDPDRWLDLAQSAWDAMLAAAPTPAEPTNPGEISSKVVEPLRDALKESEVIEASEFALANPDGETSTPLELGVVTSKPGGGFKVVFAPLRDAGAVAYIHQALNGNYWTEWFNGKNMADFREQFLYTHPAPQQQAITDAMVERAYQAFIASRGTYLGESPVDREDIRAALAAAQKGKG